MPTPLSQNSPAIPTLRFCWLRESAPGHLEADAGIPLAPSDLLLALLGLHPAQQRTTALPAVSLDAVLAALSGTVPLDTLPPWARKRVAIILGPLTSEDHRRAACQNAAILIDVAQRISELTPAGVEVEVHLPYIDRRNWAGRFAILQQAGFLYRDGRILPSELLETNALVKYQTQLLTACSLSTQPRAHLAFSQSQTVAGELLPAFLPVKGEETSAGLAGVEIQLRLPAAACRAWNTAPHESSLAYFPSHAPISVAIQQALRRWLAWYWVAGIERFHDVQSSHLVLAYLASKPFPGRRRTDFTYDPLSTRWIHNAFRGARGPLRRTLRSVHAALLAAGKPELAAQYHPDQAKFILQQAAISRNAIHSIIAAEAALINFILKFGMDIRGAADAMSLAPLLSPFVKGLGIRLRRVFREEDLTWLGSVMILEATNALWSAQGNRPALETTVRVRPLYPAPEPKPVSLFPEVPAPSPAAPPQS